MNITAEADNKICVKLTRDDMAELDITYEELDYANIETRRVLWTLLDKARRKLGKNIYLTQKMLIEAVPEENGGCSIIFTVLEEENNRCGKKRLVKINEAKIICQSDNIDNLSAMSRVLTNNGKISGSELFTDGKTYRLILYPKAPVIADIQAIISEFCDLCDDSAVPYTYEHWKKLASPDALGILSILN